MAGAGDGRVDPSHFAPPCRRGRGTRPGELCVPCQTEGEERNAREASTLASARISTGVVAEVGSRTQKRYDRDASRPVLDGAPSRAHAVRIEPL